jgi:YVTN family beta-propeller protein
LKISEFGRSSFYNYFFLHIIGLAIMKKLLVALVFVFMIVVIMPHTAHADSLIDTISLAPSMDPVGITFDPSNGYLYVTDGGSRNVSVIDGSTNTLVGIPIAVQLDPIADVFVPSNGDIYVANFHSNSISIIDGSTNLVVNTITSISSPRGVAFDPANGFLYVTDAAANTVTVIDTTTNTVIGSPIAVGTTPRGILFDPANNELYVVNNLSNSVTVIDATTNTVVGSPIPVGTTPLDAERDPLNGHIFVTNTGSNDLTVIDSSTNTVLVPSVPLGGSPHGLIFVPSNGGLYVASLAKIIEVDPLTNAVIGNIPLGTFEATAQFAFDNTNGDIYVTNQSDDFVFVIAPAPIIRQTSISTTLNSTSITIGGTVHDSATITGVQSNTAGGTVDYHIFNTGTCTPSSLTTTQTVSVVAGVVPDSPANTINTAGSYSYNATYSGDVNHSGSSSACEPLTVNPAIIPTRTLGFYQTHTTFTSALFTSGGTHSSPGVSPGSITIGSGGHIRTIDSTNKLFGAYYSSIPFKTDGTKRLSIDQARMVLLQQLLTTKLNCAAFGCDSSILALITTADGHYATGTASQMTSDASLLDAYNNLHNSVPVSGEGSATPSTSQTLASTGGPPTGKKFWDTP